MLLLLVKTLGFLVARCPEALLRLLATTLGGLIYYGHAPRRRLMHLSLEQSFPGRDRAWRRRIALASCIRVVETGLLSLAAPFLDEQRILRMASAAPAVGQAFEALQKTPRPLIIGTVHLAYWEGLTWLPFLIRPVPIPELKTIYRPFRTPALDEWLRSTRERFGIGMISRKVGVHAALHTLQRNGGVSILFDQSAGSHGFLTRFLGRECSTTPLPGMLVEKTGAAVCIVFARRHAFWRFTIDLVPVETDGTAKGVTLALNRTFENLLSTDENLCASWLWLHQRWRILDRPGERAKLIERRGGLIE